MPIRPENKAKYPVNWDEISKDIRFNRAKGRCEVCGRKNYSIYDRETGEYPTHEKWERFHELLYNPHGGYSYSTLLKKFGFVKVVLTVAHLDHNPENCEYDNLKAMCQRCHNRYDAKHRKSTRKHGNMDGQLNLFK